jgi:uncharacterized membrane protein YwzB
VTAKFIIYVVVTFMVVWSLESVNINQIFKKNRYYQARVFYMALIFSISYLVTSFLYDFMNVLS